MAPQGAATFLPCSPGLTGLRLKPMRPHSLSRPDQDQSAPKRLTPQLRHQNWSERNFGGRVQNKCTQDRLTPGLHELPCHWDSAGFLRISWTRDSIDSPCSWDSLDSRGIPSEGFSGLQRAGANQSSGSRCAGAFSASPLGPGRDGVRPWPRRTPSGHSFPSAAPLPLFRRARGSAGFALAAEAPRRLHALALGVRPLGQRKRRRGWRLRRLPHTEGLWH